MNPITTAANSGKPKRKIPWKKLFLAILIGGIILVLYVHVKRIHELNTFTYGSDLVPVESEWAKNVRKDVIVETWDFRHDSFLENTCDQNCDKYGDSKIADEYNTSCEACTWKVRYRNTKALIKNKYLWLAVKPVRSSAKKFDMYSSRVTHALRAIKTHQLDWWQFLRIPALSDYRVVGFVTKNGAMLSDGKYYYDPALYAKPTPPDITFREVAPNENEYYMIYIDCDGECPEEKLEQIYEQYGFLALISTSPNRDNLFITIAFTTKNTILQAMLDGEIYWYKRVDEVFPDWYKKDSLGKDNEYIAIQFSTYLPEEWSDDEQKNEIERIETLIRGHGGQTFNEYINEGEHSYCSFVLGDKNTLLNEPVYGDSVFQFRKNIHDFIVPAFPKNQVWDFIKDPNVLSVSKIRRCY